MKRLLFLIALCGAWPLLSRAQSISAMVEQLAELELFRQSTAKGYTIMTTGVDSIGTISNDELQLHQSYYGSLGVINPSFNSDTQLTALKNLQQWLVQQLQADIRYWQQQLYSSPSNN